MFNIKEQKGLIVLIIMITITLLSKYLNKEISTCDIETPVSDEKISVVSIKPFLLKNVRDTFSKQKHETKNSLVKIKKQKSDLTKTTIEFDFNPNTISYDSLILIGISKRAARNWTKYISNGGKFRIKNDIKKIYNLKEKNFSRIKKHILLPDSIEYSKSIVIKKAFKKKYFTQKDLKIELNSSTPEELKKLNGIGEKLSKRIVKFRDKLGGFYSIDQLKEVYGLPLDTYEKIKGNLTIDKNKIKKIKINIEDKKSLIVFPYFNYRLAIQLYNFRKQHGYFKGIDDIRKIKTMDSTKIKKIEPYLDFALN